MNLNDILKYREIYNNIKGRSEETVKIQVVLPLLSSLGFDINWVEAEKKIKSKRNIVDLCYHLPIPKEKFYVEVKAPDVDLKDKELEQLSNYQNITNMKWGLLTNGRELILLNHKIDGDVNEKQIVYINIFENLDIEKFKYLTYDSIYKTKITNYFYYLSQFKIYFKEDKFELGKETMSWKQYDSTIKAFFQYLINEFDYLNLESIRIEDFKSFMKISQNNRAEKYSKSAICNKYRHICSLLMCLYKNKIITQNPYRDISEDEALEGLEYTEKKEFVPLSDKEISEIYKAMLKTRDVKRNTLLLDFMFNMPVSGEELSNLKISDVSIDNMTIQISDREIPITKEMLIHIQKYLDERLVSGIECQYMFYRLYNKKIDKMTVGSISDILNAAVKKCSFTKERKKEIDPRFIRDNIIYNYLHIAGFSLEETIKMTNCKIKTLDNYISIDEIKSKTKIPVDKIKKYSERYFEMHH